MKLIYCKNGYRFKRLVLLIFAVTVFAVTLAVSLLPGKALADPVISEGDTWISFQDETDHVSYTVTVDPAFSGPAGDHPATLTIQAASKDGNEIVCAYKAGTLSGDLFSDSGTTYGTAGTPAASMTVNLTSPGWVYAGCKSSDLDGNPVTASISFQLPLEGGSGSGVVSLAGTTVTASVYSKNALSDWTINLKPAQAISVKSGDKLSLQAAGTMFHVVNQAVCVTDTVTGLELSPQCVYTDGKPDTLEIIFNNTAAVTIPATGVALKICNVVNPGSEQGAVCTTTPVVKLTTAQNSGQTNAPQLSFTDSTLSLVLSKTVITVNPEGKVLDGPLCVTVKLNDSAGNPLNLNKQVKIRVKNAATTSLNGIAGSNAWNNLSLAAGTGSFNIDQIKDSAVAEGSFTRTIEARLADNPFVTSEADLKVTYLNTCKISGKIVDKETNQPVPGARIEVRDSQDKILALFYSGGDGSFATVVQAGSSGSLAISKEDYATEYFSYSSADAAGNAFAMGTVKIEPYAFKIDISYGYSAATQTGPAAPIAPDNGYGPYSDPYIQKGSIKLYPDQRNGVTCYFRSGKGVARGDTVNVVLPSKTNGMLNLTRSLTIGADYGIENKVEFVDVEKGFAVIMAADNPAASQGENLVGRIYQTDNEPVFELKPGQVFTYGKKTGELENGRHDVIVMCKEASSLLPRFLDNLSSFGLVEGVDYNKYSINVADGNISALTVAAPVSPKRTVLDSDGTTIYAKPAYNLPLTPLVVKYKLKPDYQVNTRKILVSLPDGVDFTSDCGVYNTQERSFAIGYQYDAAHKQLAIETNHYPWYNLDSFVFTVKVSPNAHGKLAASLQYCIVGSGVDTAENIGTAEIAAPQISLSGPSATSTGELLVRGTAIPQALVAFYDGDTKLGEINANKAGSFEMMLVLSNPAPGSIHYLTAQTGSGAEKQSSPVLEIVYQPLLPKITRLLYQSPGCNPVELIGPNRPDWLVTSWGDNMSFAVESSDDSKINKMWVVIANGDAYNSGGQPMIVPAFYDAARKQWLTGNFNGHLNEFNPGPVSVQFTLNNYIAEPIEMKPLPANYFSNPYQYMGTTQEAYLESLPPEIKNGGVNITRMGTSGFKADITLADTAQSKITYTFDLGTPPLISQPGGVTEERLVQKGFHKLAAEGGGSIYIKETVNGEEIKDFIANDRLSSLPADSKLNIATAWFVFPAQKAAGLRGVSGTTIPAADGGIYYNLGGENNIYYPPQGGHHFSYTGQSAGAWGETLYYQAPAKQPDGSYQNQYYKFNGIKNGWEAVAPEDLPDDFAAHNSPIADSDMVGAGANWPNSFGSQSDSEANFTETVQYTVQTTADTVAGLAEAEWTASANIPGTILQTVTAGMTIQELNQYMKLQIETMEAMKNRKTGTGTLCYAMLTDKERVDFDNLLQNMQTRNEELQKFLHQYSIYNSLQAGSIGAAATPAIGTVLGLGAMTPGVNLVAATLTGGLALTGTLYNCIVGDNQLDNFRQSAQQFTELNNAWAKKFYLMCGNVYNSPAQTNPAFVIDPSGYAYEGMKTNPVAAARAELWRADDISGENARLWSDAVDYGQLNPQNTLDSGWYQWDVPAGWWQVRLTKAGYEAAQSEWLPVPPPQLGVNISMVSKALPTAALSFDQTSKKCRIEFSKPMMIDTVKAAVSLTANGVKGINLTPLNSENELARTFEGCPVSGVYLANTTYTLTLTTLAKSYAGVALDKEYTISFITSGNFPNGSSASDSGNANSPVPVLQADQPAGQKITVLGGTVKNKDGSVSLVFPADSLSNEGQVKIVELNADSVPPLGELVAGSKVFDINIENASLVKPISLTIQYNRDILKKMSADQISLYYWHTLRNQWIVLDSKVDVVNGLVTAPVTHFTKFAVLADSKLPVFTDINNHWAKADILHLAGMKVTGGYPDHTFRPDNRISRAEFARLLVTTMGWNTDSDNLSFKDSSQVPAWARSYVAAAAEKGVIKGYEDNTFRSEQKISRAEIAVMIVNALNKKDKSTTSGSINFADGESIPLWAKGSVAAAADLGIVAGKPGNIFAASDYVTRAESAAMLVRMLRVLGI